MSGELNPVAVLEHFGIPLPDDVVTPEKATEILGRALTRGKITPERLTALHADVVAGVRAFQWAAATRTLPARPYLVHGRTLAEWLSLEDVGRLIVGRP